MVKGQSVAWRPRGRGGKRPVFCAGFFLINFCGNRVLLCVPESWFRSGSRPRAVRSFLPREVETGPDRRQHRRAPAWGPPRRSGRGVSGETPRQAMGSADGKVWAQDTPFPEQDAPRLSAQVFGSLKFKTKTGSSVHEGRTRQGESLEPAVLTSERQQL